MKSLLVPFSGSDKETSALRAAFIIASQFNAHVQCLHIYRDVTESLGSLNLRMAPTAAAEIELAIRHANQEMAENASRIFDTLAKEIGIQISGNLVSTTHPSATWETDTGNAGTIVALRGRLNDLIVISQSIMEQVNYGNVIESALFDTGHPVLIIPPGYQDAIGKNITIAWNGSAETARAITYSMPFLHKAERVTIVTVGAADNAIAEAGALMDYLSFHAIKADSINIRETELSIGATLLQQVETLGSDLLVMGAFTHSRLRQMILGGATSFMLAHADKPVFFAH